MNTNVRKTISTSITLKKDRETINPHLCRFKSLLPTSSQPPITIPKLYGTASLTRRVKNVGSPGTYTARLRVPAGLSISVEPRVLKFDKIGEEKSFKITVKVTIPGEATVFGGITWSDGKHQVRSPIVVGGVKG